MGLRFFMVVGAIPVLCTSLLVPQLAVAAVAVEINDGNGGVLCSGNLVNMSTTTNQVTVGMDGNCGSGGGNLGSTQTDMGSIDEGSYSALTEFILDGVTLTPPIDIQLDSNNQPMQGAEVSFRVADNLTYEISYSAANVRVDNNTPDSFAVVVSDAVGQTATMTFDVIVNDVADPPSGGACVSTATIICKGELDLTVNGEQYAVPIDLNTTHVWTIRPENRSAYENFIFDYLSNPMTVSLSTNYAIDSVNSDCTKTVKTGNLYLSESGATYQCPAQPDTVYYLRISSQSSGRYSVFY